MNQSTLTVVILTNRNDERFLQALQSASWADEIIILDNNSANDWEALQIEKLKIVTIAEPLSNFSTHKNQAIELSSSQWIFFLDSDEVITPDLAIELRKIIAVDTVNGASVQRNDTFLSKPLRFGEVGYIHFTRLLRKGHGKWTGNVHERLEIEGEVAVLTKPLYHHSHLNISEFVSKNDHYATLRAQEVKLSKNKIRWQTITFPPGKLLFNLFIKLGILDGYRGIVYAVMMSIHSLSVRVHAFESKNNER